MNIQNKHTFNYNDVIERLQDYMLYDTKINKSLENKFYNVKNNNDNKIKKEKPKSEQNIIENFFIPKEKDSLFWCFYIIKNSEIQYEMLNNITPIIEKKLKIEYVEKIRKEKQLIKTYKFATLTHIENQLVNEFKIDIKTFFCLCVLNNINVMYINNRTYYELLMNDNKDIYIVNNFENKKFGYKLSSLESKEIIDYKSSLLKIDNIEKPIKSISSYKVSELQELCIKLVIETNNKETGKSKSKKDLYEAIIQYF